VSTAKYDGTAEERNIYLGTHVALKKESDAFRRQLCVDALTVHARECCSESAPCCLAIKIWCILGVLDKRDYLKELGQNEP